MFTEVWERERLEVNIPHQSVFNEGEDTEQFLGIAAKSLTILPWVPS